MCQSLSHCMLDMEKLKKIIKIRRYSQFIALVGLFLMFTNNHATVSSLGLERPVQGQTDGKRPRGAVSNTDYALQPHRHASRTVFLPTSQNVSVGLGDTAELKCRVENLGTRTVIWRREGHSYPLTIGGSMFAPDPRLSIVYHELLNEWSLLINNVSTSDEGIYICQLPVKEESDIYTVRLSVRTVIVTGSEYVEQGNPIRLFCNATGKPDPPHNIDWYRDGFLLNTDVTTGGMVSITKRIDSLVLISTLQISSSKTIHSGDYMCLSSDGDSAHMYVNVINGNNDCSELSLN